MSAELPKLNWFSPLPPSATDIAHFTTRVASALAPRARLTLWTNQAKFDQKLRDLATVRSFRLDRMKWAELNRAEACFYNIGNNPMFHGAIWQLAQQHAGIVVLHDTRLHHFFDGLYRVQWRNLAAYQAVMELYYGDEGRRDAADCFLNEARNINEMAEKYPLTEHALENCLAVIVHTPQAFAELSRNQARPVAYLPLPFAAAPLKQTRLREQGNSRIADRPIRLVMFGYIGRNRRLDAMLTALQEMSERERFRLDVFGEILDNEKGIKKEIRELGLQDLVTLHGFVSEEKLDEALSQADLAINLRHPTMGEASGSQLRIWAHALPSVVTQVGWYASLPAASVIHVRADENEVAVIQSTLRAFLANPGRFAEMGEQGRKLLETEHSPEAYASGLIEFVAEVKHYRARTALYGLASRTGAALSEMYGGLPTEATQKAVAEEIRALSECR
jgi:glycosyltransferase involved in cell wall biosynthesis